MPSLERGYILNEFIIHSDLPSYFYAFFEFVCAHLIFIFIEFTLDSLKELHKMLDVAKKNEKNTNEEEGGGEVRRGFPYLGVAHV